jgi:signal transduction histidine kinase/sensor domain CHASE-containing protein
MREKLEPARHGGNSLNQLFGLNKRYVPVYLVSIAGVILAIAAYYTVRYIEIQDIKTRFSLEMQNRINAVAREIEVNLEAVQSLHSFYMSSEEVTREEFRQFTAHLLSRHHSIQALEWIPRITLSQRNIYEESARAEYPNFQITEREEQGTIIRAREREEYFPAYFLEPYKGNEAALGFDLASNPTRLQALNNARDTGMIAATARITLLQEQEERYGILVFIPVYQKNVPLYTVEDRRKNLLGFVLGGFRVGDIVERTFTYLKAAGIDIYLYDVSASEEDSFLYKHESRMSGHQYAATKPERKDAGDFYIESPLKVADKKWKITGTPVSVYIARAKDWHAMAASAGVLFIICLIAIYLKKMLDQTIYSDGLVRKLGDEINVRRAVEQEREHLLSELKSKNRELQQILYVTSHDLRSPLVNVEGFSRELDFSLKGLMSELDQIEIPPAIKERVDSIIQGDIIESLHYISKSISRMDSLIKGLLSLSRLGQIELKIKQIDMNKMLVDVVSNFEFRLKESGTKVNISEMPPCRGDSGQINQVFSNLLDNAMKHLDSGQQGIITISGNQENHQSHYCIEDNGIGIAPDHHEKIFKLFHQLDPGKTNGEGLGLTIAHRIVERHHGKIWVESEPGKGSRFYVSLPA